MKSTFAPEEVKALEKKEKTKIIHIQVFLDKGTDADRAKEPNKRKSVECLLKHPMHLHDLSMMAAILEHEINLERGQFMLDNLWVDGSDQFQLNADTAFAHNPEVRFAGAIAAIQAIKSLDSAIVKH